MENEDQARKIHALRSEIEPAVEALLKLMSEYFKAKGHSKWAYTDRTTGEHIRVEYTPF